MKQRTPIVRWDTTDFQGDCCLMERPGCQSIQRIAFLEWEIKLLLLVAQCFPIFLFDLKISSYRSTDTWTTSAKQAKQADRGCFEWRGEMRRRGPAVRVSSPGTEQRLCPFPLNEPPLPALDPPSPSPSSLPPLRQPGGRVFQTSIIHHPDDLPQLP